MPHLVLQYTADLEPEARIDVLCARLAEVLVGQRDAAGVAVFPIAGTRVLAYPARHHAVADGHADRGFCYLNLRIAPGREAALVHAAGEAVMAAVRDHFAEWLEERSLGITLQIDEGEPVYYAKGGNLHAAFAVR